MNTLKYIAGQFEKPTGFGGQISTLIMNIINRKMYSKTIDILNITNKDTILDIGFGNGKMLKKISSFNPQKLYGIDISEDMLKSAIQLNTTAISANKMELFLADVQNLPFADNFFDKIYTINTVYFWQNYENCFSEIKRILKPDGLFINTCLTKKQLEKLIITKYGFNKFTLEELKNLTEQNGFSDVDIVEIEKDKSVCIIAKNKKIGSVLI
ncbi:MAG: class I SAM-dependent methyltransferase [Prevotellaceae bacterium]|jgi:ubiquinone/menaquinone biosynthesis C-methylase UbiE|nr:class I SAM-dependent methyltransferase [Prevotellaceae bacterium]